MSFTWWTKKVGPSCKIWKLNISIEENFDIEL